MPRDNALETVQVEGLTVSIFSDPDPSSPREDDNLGLMVCWHRRYHLGDHDENPFDSPSAFQEWVGEASSLPADEQPRCILPLGLYDHSGITMYVGTSGPCPWDSGQVGYIYTTNKRLRDAGHEYPESLLDEAVEEWLRGEVTTYDQFLTGQVYGYVVSDSEDEDLESCWGFYGLSYCLEEATSAAEHILKGREAERLKEMEERDGA